MLDREGIQHEVVTKAAIHRRQPLQRRGAYVGGAQTLRQTLRQCYGRIHRRGRK